MRAARSRRRRGSSIIELTVTSVLMAVVALILAKTWAVFGRPAISTVARARIAQEANLAAATLADDIGRLARPDPEPTDSRYANVQASTDGTTLSFTIDDGTGTLRGIQYARDPTDGSKLVRTDSTASAGSGRVVATLVSGFQVTRLTDQDEFGCNGVRVDLTLTHWTYERDRDGSLRGDHTRQFTLFIPDAH